MPPAGPGRTGRRRREREGGERCLRRVLTGRAGDRERKRFARFARFASARPARTRRRHTPPRFARSAPARPARTRRRHTSLNALNTLPTGGTAAASLVIRQSRSFFEKVIDWALMFELHSDMDHRVVE